jgi:hypothetical protein
VVSVTDLYGRILGFLDSWKLAWRNSTEQSCSEAVDFLQAATSL